MAETISPINLLAPQENQSKVPKLELPTVAIEPEQIVELESQPNHAKEEQAIPAVISYDGSSDPAVITPSPTELARLQEEFHKKMVIAEKMLQIREAAILDRENALATKVAEVRSREFQLDKEWAEHDRTRCKLNADKVQIKEREQKVTEREQMVAKSIVEMEKIRQRNDENARNNLRRAEELQKIFSGIEHISQSEKMMKQQYEATISSKKKELDDREKAIAQRQTLLQDNLAAEKNKLIQREQTIIQREQALAQREREQQQKNTPASDFTKMTVAGLIFKMQEESKMLHGQKQELIKLETNLLKYQEELRQYDYKQRERTIELDRREEALKLAQMPRQANVAQNPHQANVAPHPDCPIFTMDPILLLLLQEYGKTNPGL